MRQILADNIIEMIQNPFGNYAITTALEVRISDFFRIMILEMETWSMHWNYDQDQRELLSIWNPQVLFECHREMRGESRPGIEQNHC